MATESTHNLVQIKPRPTAEAAVPSLDLEAVKETLGKARGPRYWRSLEELTRQEGFTEMMEREFPRHAGEWIDTVSRRGFLKLMSASMALAGLSACTKQPSEAIVPYVQQPEDLIPGKPMYFATARPTAFGAQPLLVTTHMFRPIKVEGNPQHPYSLGATDAQSQAAVLDLYDPDRSQVITYREITRTWSQYMEAVRSAFAADKSANAGVRILSETVTSPTLAAQIRSVLAANPNAKWIQYEAVNRDSARIAGQAMGGFADAQYNLKDADIVLSLDADFLSGSTFPGFIKMAREFAQRRKLDGGGELTMNRLYVVESQTSTTGGKADHRLPLRAADVEQFAAALAAALGIGGTGGSGITDAKAKKFLDALAVDLKAHSGRAVVIPGEQQSPAVHALAAGMNVALGAVGKTVTYTETVEYEPTIQAAAMKTLVDDMKAGRVATLLMVGVNPVFDAPADLDFKLAMDKVQLRIHAGCYTDETSRLSHWHIPMTHFMESWSDARCSDGSVAIVQPLIEPLYGGRSAHEIIGVLTETPGLTAYEWVRESWQKQAKAADFETWWRRVLHDGVVSGTGFAARSLSPRPLPLGSASPTNQMEIVFRPDPNILDGRHINNGWLQELPRPITKLSWDNAILVSFATAQAKQWKTRDIIEIEANGMKVKAPVLVVPGHPDNSVTLHLGFGRTNTGRVGAGTGFNAYLLRNGGNPHVLNGAKFTKVESDAWVLALSQNHHLIEADRRFPNNPNEAGEPVGSSHAGNEAVERSIVRAATLEQYKKDPHFVNAGTNHPAPRELSLYPDWTTDPTLASPHQWGMAIDMNSCVGCNSCVVACQAENNIPVVGKDQVAGGRIMQWIRIDTYFESRTEADVSNPRAYFQPLPCMHCEAAPCEPVCPVAATVHSPEGLNNMTYNRCVGTRYCSNNCPYKVRRFNYLLYADFETESLKSMRNPDVSVRSRGVMEKCTYCVQRINSARITAEKRVGTNDENGQAQDGTIRDGEVVTACQQSCPTNAIVFGNIADPKSRVSQIKRDHRNYAMLAELNTRPRTTYLAAVRNPNPALEAETSHTEKAAHAG